jgi:hypothetical protein
MATRTMPLSRLTSRQRFRVSKMQKQRLWQRHCKSLIMAIERYLLDMTWTDKDSFVDLHRGYKSKRKTESSVTEKELTSAISKTDSAVQDELDQKLKESSAMEGLGFKYVVHLACRPRTLAWAVINLFLP